MLFNHHRDHHLALFWGYTTLFDRTEYFSFRRKCYFENAIVVTSYQMENPNKKKNENSAQLANTNKLRQSISHLSLDFKAVLHTFRSTYSSVNFFSCLSYAVSFKITISLVIEALAQLSFPYTAVHGFVTSKSSMERQKNTHNF